MRATERRISMTSTPTAPPMTPPTLPLGMAPLSAVASATAPVVPLVAALDIPSVVVLPVEKIFSVYT